MRNLCLLIVGSCVFAASMQSADAQYRIEPIDENPVTRAQVEELLELPWPDLNLDTELPVAELLEKLEEQLVKTSGTPIFFRPDKLELELESISSLEDMIVKKVEIREGSVTVKTGLTHYFDQTDPRLSVISGPGHFLVTTRAKANDTYRTCMYDLSPFLLRNTPAQKNVAAKRARMQTVRVELRQADVADDSFADNEETQRKSRRTKRSRRSSAKRNSTPEASIDNSSLLELIQTQTSPICQWEKIDGGTGAISLHGQYAFIRQTDAGHEMIESLLASMQKAIDENGPLKQTNFDRFRETEPVERVFQGSGGGAGIF